MLFSSLCVLCFTKLSTWTRPLRWSSCTDSWLWGSLCGTSLPSRCSSVFSGLSSLSSSCSQTPCPPNPRQQEIRESSSSCSQGAHFTKYIYSSTVCIMWVIDSKGYEYFFHLSWCDYVDYYSFVCVFTWQVICFNNCSFFGLLHPSVCLNVVPHRTPSWVWPSWFPISLSGCSTYASSTWEVTQPFWTRTSCTGEICKCIVYPSIMKSCAVCRFITN